MRALAALLKKNESWLMRRIRDYAVEREYSRYTSTLEEAWKISVSGLTDAIISALAISERPWELSPDEDFVSDPIAAFGVLEAQRHRARGVTLSMFMGLMKYYRQTYIDLLQSSFAPLGPYTELSQHRAQHEDGGMYLRFIERVFDRIEIAFCSDWSRSETVDSAIDELQDANRRITNEKNKFLTIFESMPTAVFLLDDAGRIVHMNLAGAQMLNPDATAGEHYYSQPEARIPFPWIKEQLDRFREQGEEKECQYLVELSGGEPCQVLARLHPMQDVSFKYPGTVVILKDITEHKKAEEELQQAQSRLVQQEKMASLGQLAAGVAHEINNPIGFLTSNLSSLEKYVERLIEFIEVEDRMLTHPGGPDLEQVNDLRKELKIDFISDDARELIEESLEGADRVRRIVQNLKNFSRPDHAEYELADLNQCLESAISIAWNEIKSVATLKREFGDIPQLWCCPQLLNQVFLNLLLNAVQALEGQGVISVRTWSDRRRVFVSVADSGRGIPPALRSRVFEPFFTTKEVGTGTGLGLSISYGIAQKHGGEIEVRSKEGEGSTFTLSLPLKAAREAPAA